MSEPLWRRLLAEGLGTAFLLATVVGSGIMGTKLAGGNIAIALLGNTLPTGAILVVLILIFGPVSGAHMNPAVSLAFALRRELDVAPPRRVRGRADRRGGPGRVGGASDVRTSGLADFNALAQRPSAMVVGSRGDIRPAADGLGLRGARSNRCTLRGWPLHYSCLLVHGLDVVRQPGRDGRPRAVGHLCRDRTFRCCDVYLGAGGRNARGTGADALDLGETCASQPITRWPCGPICRRLFAAIVTVDRFGLSPRRDFGPSQCGSLLGNSISLARPIAIDSCR
jgi:ABC-type proline/glycine betaine transport system permease subunit